MRETTVDGPAANRSPTKLGGTVGPGNVGGDVGGNVGETVGGVVGGTSKGRL